MQKAVLLHPRIVAGRDDFRAVIGLRAFARAGFGLVVFLSACGSDGPRSATVDVAAYAALHLGATWSYDVEDSGLTLPGEVQVRAEADTAFKDGLSLLVLDIRSNNRLEATRWIEVGLDGLLMWGEEAQEGGRLVRRTYAEAIRLLQAPLEDKTGTLVQSWLSTSALAEGGQESHRFDNSGKASLTVPAGTFEAYHLIHTWTDKDGGNHQVDLHFVPQVGFVQFGFGDGEAFRLKN